MNAMAAIFYDDEDVVPQSSSFGFGVFPNHRVEAVFFITSEHAFGDQGFLEFNNQLVDLGLYALVVKVFKLFAMAFLADSEICFKGVIVIGNMAGHAGVFYHPGMYRLITFNASTANTK